MGRSMKDDWWFKFEHLKWLTDEQLNRCGLETQGFWMRCICVMRKSGCAKLSGPITELSRVLNVTPAEFKRCLNELSQTKTATVTQTSQSVTLLSRKFHKELKVKEQNRLRQQRKRRHAPEPDESQPHNKSKELEIEKEEEKREEEPPTLDASVANDLVISETESAFNITLDRDTRKLVTQAIPTRLAHLFPAFIRGRAVGWGKKPNEAKLQRISYSLTDFQKDNKVNTNGAITKYSNKRTDADVERESIDFYEQYPS